MIQVLHIGSNNPEPERIRIAADSLCYGKLVTFPTETVYGLGANALDTRAVAWIFEAKCRPRNDPLIVHMAEASWIRLLSGMFIGAMLPYLFSSLTMQAVRQAA